ncbi:hypothetical protein D3C86_1049560 [compost metagenome]
MVFLVIKRALFLSIFVEIALILNEQNVKIVLKLSFCLYRLFINFNQKDIVEITISRHHQKFYKF